MIAGAVHVDLWRPQLRLDEPRPPSRHFSPRRAAAIACAVALVLSACSSAPSRHALGARLAKAEAMFAERCKRSGEFIHRTVEDVEGVYLLKVRPRGINYDNQFELDDPYGSDLGGDGYITSFVRGSYQANMRGMPAPGSPPRVGYRFVEAIDPKDGQRYRYTGRLEEPWQRDKSFLKGYVRFVLDKALAPALAPRYGVTYDDISTREDREYWIAGSSLKIVDLQTNEVIAERLGYMMDRGQGNNSGGRSPWLLAANNACPSFFRDRPKPYNAPASAYQDRQAQIFVEKVLKPTIRKEE